MRVQLIAARVLVVLLAALLLFNVVFALAERDLGDTWWLIALNAACLAGAVGLYVVRRRHSGAR
ncbi:hypothetical protein GCM10010972_34830 [Cellulomonas carbonis]|nr:hypothetical protein GCM10010972_34830 [Cellulomonas carbonis]